MDEAKAREILGHWIKPDGGLYCLGKYIAYNAGEDTICLDDNDFTLLELEAIVWWMRRSIAAAPAKPQE